jgi:hypothetical protein
MNNGDDVFYLLAALMLAVAAVGFVVAALFGYV